MLEQVQGVPRVLIRLAHQVAPHDLVMGGISRAGSQHNIKESSGLSNMLPHKPLRLYYHGRKGRGTKKPLDGNERRVKKLA